MEKHIYFVRHGESESNVDGVHRAHEAVLTERGRAQAQIVAERVAKIGVEALISSDFVRALDTASTIGEHINIKPEVAAVFGEWLEPSVNLNRHKDHPESILVRQATFAYPTDPHAKHSDEESFYELSMRARAAIHLLEEHPASRICVVTHGAFLRVLAGVILFRENYSKLQFTDLFLHLVTNNTGVTYARKLTDAKGWQLITWNDSAHLG